MRRAFAALLFLTAGSVAAAPAPVAAPACAVDAVILSKRGNPARCPAGQTAVPKGVAITANGCGLEPALDFHACCNAHDTCYCTCSRTKLSCDDTFLTCMTNRCNALYDDGIQLSACVAAANTYHAAVAIGADIPFMSATDKFCDCV